MRVQYLLLPVVACHWSLNDFKAMVKRIADLELTVPKPSVIQCNQIHKHLGQGNCYVFNTSDSKSYISPLRALYMLEIDFQRASKKLAEGLDNIQVVMKKNPNCRVVVTKPESLGSPQMTGSITISEESAKETEKGWGTSSTLSYSTPGSFIAGVTVSISAEYHKSIVTSTSNSVGQKLMVKKGTICTPKLARYSVLCDPVSKIFFFKDPNHPSSSFSVSQNKGREAILLPLSNHAPKFFSASVGCIGYPTHRKH